MEEFEERDVGKVASEVLGNVAEKGDSTAIQALIKRMEEDKDVRVRRATGTTKEPLALEPIAGAGFLSAAEKYDNIVDRLNGCDSIAAFKDRSEAIKGTIKERIRDEVPWSHEEVFHHLGLKQLMEFGE